MKAESVKRSLQFGSRQISYRLVRQKRKRLRIVVSPDLTVEIFAPESAKDSDIEIALQKKAAWIARTLDKMDAHQPLPAPKRYVSGESLVYLGRQYRLKVETGKHVSAKLLGKYLLVRLPQKTDVATVRRSVETWYRNRAQDLLGRYLQKWCDIAKRHGVPEPKLTIRLMKKRWGSCSASGRITLNLWLVQVPAHCIEYVIIHELCHLKYHNHSKAFYALLTRCQPDWRRRKEILDRFKLS